MLKLYNCFGFMVLINKALARAAAVPSDSEATPLTRGTSDYMRDDSTTRFMSHFKIPKSEINKIRKEYNTAKEASEKIDPDKYKDFREMAEKVFDVFEEVAGKKCNRDVMIGHLSYYFDEGFEVEDMKLYVLSQISVQYFKERPEMFTIPILFPIKDQDRINTAWDYLAYYQGLRNKTAKAKEGPKLLSRCGHPIDRDDKYCRVCILNGNALEIAINPYAPEVPDDYQEFASFFRRQNEESFDEYQARTMPEFKKLMGFKK